MSTITKEPRAAVLREECKDFPPLDLDEVPDIVTGSAHAMWLWCKLGAVLLERQCLSVAHRTVFVLLCMAYDHLKMLQSVKRDVLQTQAPHGLDHVDDDLRATTDELEALCDVFGVSRRVIGRLEVGRSD